MAPIDQNVLKSYASKYIWWKTPEDAVSMPERVVAQVMNIGDFDDMQALAREAGDEFLRHVIRHAQAGQEGWRAQGRKEWQDRQNPPGEKRYRVRQDTKSDAASARARQDRACARVSRQSSDSRDGGQDFASRRGREGLS